MLTNADNIAIFSVQVLHDKPCFAPNNALDEPELGQPAYGRSWYMIEGMQRCASVCCNAESHSRKVDENLLCQQDEHLQQGRETTSMLDVP